MNKLRGQIYVYIHLSQIQHTSISIKNFDPAIFIPKYMVKTTSCNVIYASVVLALWTKQFQVVVGTFEPFSSRAMTNDKRLWNGYEGKEVWIDHLEHLVCDNDVLRICLTKRVQKIESLKSIQYGLDSGNTNLNRLPLNVWKWTNHNLCSD